MRPGTGFRSARLLRMDPPNMTTPIRGLLDAITRWRMRRIAARRLREMFPAILGLTFVLAGGIAVPAASADDALAPPIADAELDGADDYDPWHRFNEKMFFFNHDVLDRFLVKPVAKGWSKVIPDVGKRGLDRAFDNLGMPKRLANNLLQGRFRGAGRELARFGINTTAGVVGFLDVARAQLHIEKSDADMGQTLGVYGFGPGPYLVLPTLAPLTVRDGIGYGIDGLMDPFGYLIIPFFAATAMSVVKQVNERSLNLEVFQDVENSVLDLYSAVRNGYLQRRRRSIEEADAARHAEWHPPSRAVAQR
jgi:phospholipid-binding lipoprotein MlaA